MKDILLCCSDPKDIDVVIKAVKALCAIFCDILPTYRIREQKEGANEEGEKKVSKDVQSMRDYEQTMLSAYKEYLKILEVFVNTKPERIIKK